MEALTSASSSGWCVYQFHHACMWLFVWLLRHGRTTDSAEGGSRTHMGLSPRRNLNPVCLPIPPHPHKIDGCDEAANDAATVRQNCSS